MANPVSNYQVSGIVKDRLGDIIVGATVTLTHDSISPVLSTETGSDGKYILNLSGLDTQWSAGQEITLFSTTQFKGRKFTTVTITSGASQTVNLTMEETSDFSILGTDNTERFNLNFATITTYDQEKVTNINPLPVQAPIDVDLIFNPSHSWEVTNQDGQPESETVTLADGSIYKRTFTYTNVSGARILTTRSKWERQ